MNIDATETEIRDIAEVLKLAAIIDDRAPRADKARIAGWAEQIHRHKLERTDLLDGLQLYYDSPSERPIQIGDLIHHAKAARRARLERMDDEERRRREDLADEKAADDIRGLSAAFIAGRVDETPRLKAAREALETCQGKTESLAAMREFGAAKLAAKKRRHPVARVSAS